MMNMIMEKNFTCLYYKNEAYLDRVYIQQINDIDLKYGEYDYGKEFYLIILQTWSLPGQGLHSKN